MKRNWAITTALLLLLPLSAQASPQLDGPRPSASGWDEIRLELHVAPLIPQRTSFREDPLRLYFLPEQAPESLAIDVPVHRVFGLFVSADLDAVLPRLDSIDQETYFSVGAKAHVSDSLTVFVEDFMGASAVIGSDEDRELEPVARRSWDGHQVAAGVLFAAHDQVTLRGELIGYVLSEGRRRDGLGGTVSVTVRF